MFDYYSLAPLNSILNAIATVLLTAAMAQLGDTSPDQILGRQLLANRS